MTDSTVTKGHFTIPDRGITKHMMFNPSTINDSKAIEFGTLKIPGASHPVYQSGAGGDRSITFTLYFDGDRGRFKNVNTGADAQNQGLSIERELSFYESLVYPGSVEVDGMEALFPYIILFSFGPRYQATPCIVTKADISITDWTNKLVPMRATIDIELKETVDRVRTNNETYADYDFG